MGSRLQGLREGDGLKCTFGLIGSILFLGPLNAQETCPVEAKLLLSSSITQPLIASFGFDKKTAGLVYFFDTESLDLLMQGVIVRVRQGAKNDLTIKLRAPTGSQELARLQLRDKFPCEIDRTSAADITSYAVVRPYTAVEIPVVGKDIYGLLSYSQRKLLIEARVSIDWSRVTRIADVSSTTWHTGARSPYGKLALELWEWPAGKILELSSKVPPGTDGTPFMELQRLMKIKDLSLEGAQDTKTNIVLETVANHDSSAR
jgi:hypothetical protein